MVNKNFKFNSDIFEDIRGSFLNLTLQIRLANIKFGHIKQVNISSNNSSYVFRGIHANKLNNEGKLLKVLYGSIKGAIFDINKKSNTYGLTYRFILSAKSQELLYVPPGFANGYITLEPNTKILYLHNKEYNPKNNITFNGNFLLEMMKDFGLTNKVIMSDNDANSTNFFDINFKSIPNDLCDW